jgi:hypothetical protein
MIPHNFFIPAPSALHPKHAMKAFLSTCVVAACLAVSVHADEASDKVSEKAVSPKSSEVDVQASSDLRVAVVDGTQPSAERSALHDAFAASLSASMSKHCGGKVNVDITEVDAFRIAFDLKAGMYDAVFVIGNNVPPALRKGDFEVLRAVSDFGAPGKVFHMVIPSEDPSLQHMVAASFPDALASPKFQEAVTHAVAIKLTPDVMKKAASVADSTR